MVTCGTGMHGSRERGRAVTRSCRGGDERSANKIADVGRISFISVPARLTSPAKWIRWSVTDDGLKLKRIAPSRSFERVGSGDGPEVS